MSNAIICDDCGRIIEKRPALIIIIHGTKMFDYCNDCAKRIIERLKPEGIKHE